MKQCLRSTSPYALLQIQTIIADPDGPIASRFLLELLSKDQAFNILTKNPFKYFEIIGYMFIIFDCFYFCLVFRLCLRSSDFFS